MLKCRTGSEHLFFIQKLQQPVDTAVKIYVNVNEGTTKMGGDEQIYVLFQ